MLRQFCRTEIALPELEPSPYANPPVTVRRRLCRITIVFTADEYSYDEALGRVECYDHGVNGPCCFRLC